MTTIHTAYRRAFRSPLILGGTVFAALFAFLAWGGDVVQGCVQSFTWIADRGHLGFLIASFILFMLASIFVISFWWQWLITRRFLRSLTPSDTYAESSNASLVVVEESTVQCFCAGFFTPKIYIARHVLTSLTREELNAVLAHEDMHRRNRDPLRSALLRALVHAFFFLPLARSYERRYHETKEIMADTAALALPNGKQSLASALYALAQYPQRTFTGISFFADRTLLDLRIAFMSGHVYIPLPITWSKIAVSILVLAAPIFFFIAPSHAETVPIGPCREIQTIETHPFPLPPLRYNFLNI